MIFVKKPATDDETWNAHLAASKREPEWKSVLVKSKAESNQLLQDFNSDKAIGIREGLYKRYMSFLQDVFHGKCAYCESKFSANQPGDVEHFRPKGRVVDENFRPVRVRHPLKGEIEHPGYFWLAYDWMNLLPSCTDCNRYRKHGRAGGGANQAIGAGKADRFPVDGLNACTPADVNAERPLLLNPAQVDPNEHLEFRTDGTIRAKTRLGEVTLRLLGLNLREALVEGRRLAFEDTHEVFQGCLRAISDGNPLRISQLTSRVNDMWFGHADYAAMRRMAIQQVRSTNARCGVQISMPLPVKNSALT